MWVGRCLGMLRGLTLVLVGVMVVVQVEERIGCCSCEGRGLLRGFLIPGFGILPSTTVHGGSGVGVPWFVHFGRFWVPWVRGRRWKRSSLAVPCLN